MKVTKEQKCDLSDFLNTYEQIEILWRKYINLEDKLRKSNKIVQELDLYGFDFYLVSRNHMLFFRKGDFESGVASLKNNKLENGYLNSITFEEFEKLKNILFKYE
ncbi:MAG: hypothetical protein M0O97_07985 [Arcobacteraceae bacterium]|jgi:hypothetical protein|nr:hypothetical protein [Arcobacteraceae bacterium]